MKYTHKHLTNTHTHTHFHIHTFTHTRFHTHTHTYIYNTYVHILLVYVSKTNKKDQSIRIPAAGILRRIFLPGRSLRCHSEPHIRRGLPALNPPRNRRRPHRNRRLAGAISRRSLTFALQRDFGIVGNVLTVSKVAPVFFIAPPLWRLALYSGAHSRRSWSVSSEERAVPLPARLRQPASGT